MTGGSLTFTASADITTPTIQWQASVNGGGSWINVSGATNPTLTSRAADRVRERLGGQGHLHQLFGVGDDRPGDDHGDPADDQCRAAVEQRHAVGQSVPRRRRLIGRDQGPVRGDRRNPEQRRDRHRRPRPSTDGWRTGIPPPCRTGRTPCRVSRPRAGSRARVRASPITVNNPPPTTIVVAAVEQRHAVGHAVPRRHRLSRE